jgi:hypothetical protein
MATKDDDFKERFIAVMKNLHSDGQKDAEAMWLTGSLAARLVDKARQGSWTQFKATRTKRGYDQLLADFSAEGNGYHSQGKAKHAYAVQLLAMSMVARYQKDEDIQFGLRLLDELIDRSIVTYKKNKNAAPGAN